MNEKVVLDSKGKCGGSPQSFQLDQRGWSVPVEANRNNPCVIVSLLLQGGDNSGQSILLQGLERFRSGVARQRVGACPLA